MQNRCLFPSKVRCSLSVIRQWQLHNVRSGKWRSNNWKAHWTHKQRCAFNIGNGLSWIWGKRMRKWSLNGEEEKDNAHVRSQISAAAEATHNTTTAIIIIIIIIFILKNTQWTFYKRERERKGKLKGRNEVISSRSGVVASLRCERTDGRTDGNSRGGGGGGGSKRSHWKKEGTGLGGDGCVCTVRQPTLYASS